mgnify:CR=1 FL=1
MKLRNKQTRKIYTVRKDIFVSIIDTGKIEVRVMTPGGHVSFFYSSFDEMLNDWEDYKPAEPQIADEMAREIIKKWYNKNKIVGKLCSYGGNLWLGLRGSDKDGNDWKIELHVRYNSMLKDDKLYSLTELIGEEE